MTRLELLEIYLPEEEGRRFINNMEVPECLTLKCNHPRFFFNGSFIWDDTIEGYDYWANLLRPIINSIESNGVKISDSLVRPRKPINFRFV